MENTGETSSQDVEGHLPIEYRDGYFWLEGEKIQPDVKIGPERIHRQAFIEYERTFGRGLAKTMTHYPDSRIQDDQVLKEKYGEDFIKEYNELAQDYIAVVQSGSLEEVKSLIDKLQEYRKKHLGLYSDVSKDDGKIFEWVETNIE